MTNHTKNTFYKQTTEKRPGISGKLSHSEVVTILISFHLGECRNSKHYYKFYGSQYMNKELLKKAIL